MGTRRDDEFLLRGVPDSKVEGRELNSHRCARASG